MRIAAIDIGTNSVHMIVVQVRDDHSFEVVDREKEMVRLGAGGLGGRALTEATRRSALLALARFKRLADSHHVDEVIGCATSAVREAENGREFLAEIQHRTGIQTRMISGSEEARLIHRAAVYGVDVAGSAAVVVDIGGGSVELTLGRASRPQIAESLKLGVIRLTERFVRSDPISDRDERRMVRHIMAELAPAVTKIREQGFDRVIGTSGTILSLGALAADAAREDRPDELRNLRVPVKQVRRLRKELTALDLPGRIAIPGLDPRRADLAVAGSILLSTILRLLGARELTLCDLALREGLALDYIDRNRAHIARVDQFPDIRRRSVVELADRCRAEEPHTEQVVRMALALFDQTAALHGLGAREREWLEYAAMLHDVGVHISYPRHHRHSYYLIRNGDLRGFEPGEVEVMALAARYHRRGLPKRSHGEFGGLPGDKRRTVRVLAAILRVAEGLDRSHAQSVGSIEVVAGQQDCVIRVTPAGDTELELWAAQRNAGPLEKLLGRVIRCELAITAPARPALAARAALTSSPAPDGRRRADLQSRGNRLRSTTPAARPSGTASGEWP
ncbi:MAG: Ppx/GppA family phosphatase [Acidobacteria bacterium]|nr:Ppx/GppA family phosphatase [Acidobacteriota bacterium]MYD70667.1 Ppx/GppA family phosphatase [Acidobacteriota bacterium]MYJ03289.1 Ppx/GppA family phosphatase [Acidobacteriota bacterium]